MESIRDRPRPAGAGTRKQEASTRTVEWKAGLKGDEWAHAIASRLSGGVQPRRKVRETIMEAWPLLASAYHVRDAKAPRCERGRAGALR